jgi:hypothetical protein
MNEFFSKEGPMYSAPRVTVIVEEVFHCYNVVEDD